MSRQGDSMVTNPINSLTWEAEVQCAFPSVARPLKPCPSVGKSFEGSFVPCAQAQRLTGRDQAIFLLVSCFLCVPVRFIETSASMRAMRPAQEPA